MRRTPIAVAIVAVALVGIALFSFLHRPAAPVPEAAAAPAVATAAVTYGAYDVTLDESGSVGAPAGTTTKASFAIPGIVASIDVAVGQRVAAGTRLASLQSTALALDAEQARAEAAAAADGYAGGAIPGARLRATRAQAQAAHERVTVDRAAVEREQRLFDGGVAAHKDVEAAQAQLAADEAAAVAAEADVRNAQSQPGVLAAQAAAARAHAASTEHALAQAALYAPTSGVVTAILKRPGESVDTTTPVVAIGPPQVQATLAVPGTDAAQIKVGDPVVVRVDGLPAANGKVVGVVPSVDPTTQSATIVVSGIPPGAVAGTSVRAQIAVAHVHGVLVPQTAIVQDPQTGNTLVFVSQRQADGHTKFAAVPVEVAHEDGTTAEIASGVRPGDRVAAQGGFSLLAPSEGSDP